MGVRILNGDHNSGAVLYDSVSGWAFGPVFDDYVQAQDFLAWLDETEAGDPRNFTDYVLRQEISDWRRARVRQKASA